MARCLPLMRRFIDQTGAKSRRLAKLASVSVEHPMIGALNMIAIRGRGDYLAAFVRTMCCILIRHHHFP